MTKLLIPIAALLLAPLCLASSTPAASTEEAMPQAALKIRIIKANLYQWDKPESEDAKPAIKNIIFELEIENSSLTEMHTISTDPWDYQPSSYPSGTWADDWHRSSSNFNTARIKTIQPGETLRFSVSCFLISTQERFITVSLSTPVGISEPTILDTEQVPLNLRKREPGEELYIPQLFHCHEP